MMFKELFTEGVRIKAGDVKVLAKLIQDVSKILKKDPKKEDIFYDLIDDSHLDQSVASEIESSLGETPNTTQSNLISGLTSAFHSEGTEPDAAISYAEQIINKFLRKHSV